MPDPITITGIVATKPANHQAGDARVTKFVLRIPPVADKPQALQEVAVWGPAANDASAVLDVGDEIIVTGTWGYSRYLSRRDGGQIAECELGANAIGLTPATVRAKLEHARQEAIRQTETIHRIKEEARST